MSRPWMQVNFPRAFATPQQLQFNAKMSRVREAAEGLKKNVKQIWTLQDLYRALKVRKAPVSLAYKAAALLRNFKVCIHGGGEVQSFFSCALLSHPTYSAGTHLSTQPTTPISTPQKHRMTNKSVNKHPASHSCPY